MLELPLLPLWPALSADPLVGGASEIRVAAKHLQNTYRQKSYKARAGAAASCAGVATGGGDCW